MNKKVLVFDADDTLWYNAHKYHLPMLEAAQIICQALGVKSVHPVKVMELYDRIDRQAVKEEGFDKDRFANSWIKVYRQICEQRQVRPNSRIEAVIFKVADKFRQPPFPMIRGAKKVLTELKKKGYYLILLTAGDQEIQQTKIKTNKIEKYFEEIIITPLSKKEYLQEIVQRFGRENVVMIGNSKRSDIGAALTIPIKAVYIPAFTWSYESKTVLDKELYQKYVREINKIDQLLNIF